MKYKLPFGKKLYYDCEGCGAKIEWPSPRVRTYCTPQCKKATYYRKHKDKWKKD